jgi:Tfp pilus assembly protein PilN
MASINLVKQIKNRKSGGTKTGILPGTSAAGIKGFFQNLTATTGKLDSKEKLLLSLFIFGILSIFGTRAYLSEFYFPSQEVVVQNEIAALDSKMNEVRTKLSAFDSVKNDIDSYEKKMAEVREKLTVIESVQKGRNAIVRMVDFIINEMPSALWLSQIKVETFFEKINSTLPPATGGGAAPGGAAPGTTADNSIGTVSVKGQALSLQLVSEFLKRLEGAVFFPKWTLVETREDSSGGVGLAAAAAGAIRSTDVPLEKKSFEINAKVMGLP